MKAYIYRTHYKERSEEIFVKRVNYLDDDSKTEATISPIEKE